jgi:hypothetical protein
MHNIPYNIYATCFLVLIVSANFFIRRQSIIQILNILPHGNSCTLIIGKHFLIKKQN